MIHNYNIPGLNTDGLAAFIAQASTLDLSARLQYFYELFPYAGSLPGSLSLLDKDSKILACNEYAWKQVTLESPTQLIDHTTEDVERALGWRASLIGRARRNDIRVLQEGQSVHHESIIEGGLEKVLVCKKQAIYGENGAPLGILSLALPIPKISQAIIQDEQKRKVYLHLDGPDSISFSMREFSVLQGLLKGSTAHEIAIMCGISTKTVETYIMRIKIKLACDKQRDVISLLIKNDLARDILLFDRENA